MGPSKRLKPDFNRDLVQWQLYQVFHPGAVYVGYGNVGTGKTNLGAAMIQKMAPLEDYYLLSNIVWRNPPPFHWTVTNLRDTILRVCRILVEFFDNLDDHGWDLYKRNIAPPGSPRIVLIIDEMENVIHKQRSGTAAAHTLGNLFLPMIRKLRLAMFLIYHEKEDPIRTLREGEQLDGRIYVPEKEWAVPDLKGYPPHPGWKLIPMAEGFDTWSIASFSIGDIDLVEVYNEVSALLSEHVPAKIIEILTRKDNDDNGNDRQAFIPNDEEGLKQVAALLKSLGTIPERTIEEVTGVKRTTFRDRARKYY